MHLIMNVIPRQGRGLDTVSSSCIPSSSPGRLPAGAGPPWAPGEPPQLFAGSRTEPALGFESGRRPFGLFPSEAPGKTHCRRRATEKVNLIVALRPRAANCTGSRTPR